MSKNLFPTDPDHGDLVELEPGLFFQYDGKINSWVKIVSSSVNLPLATNRKAGAMTAIDLKKLNRMVLPPPQSTVVGNDCLAPFQNGAIELYGGDKFVDVSGNLDIQNIDSVGDTINEQHPFHIHQHTYGFDFTLDIPRLVQELTLRDQIKILGTTGDKGIAGADGDDGINEILTGDAGEQGTQGTAPECDLSIDTEVVSAEVKSGLRRALTNVRVLPHPTDPTKYNLEFDRQVVGSDAAVSRFNVKQSHSFWVLAVASISGAPQQIFYLDIDPVIESIRQKFITEMDRLKQGYEDIVAFWVQTMSDLFDEQKTALCCALEFCMSKRKSVDLRHHMESVAAGAIGSNGAKINLHGRNSNDSVEISSTRVLNDLPDGKDLCKEGPDFPQNPAADGGGGSSLSSAEAGVEAEKASIQAIDPISIAVDPLLNAGSLKNSIQVELPQGKYSATIESLDSRIGTTHGGVIRIQHMRDGAREIAQFLDKGGFDSLIDAKDAYEGLSLSFSHDGGLIYLYFPIIPTMNASGQTVIRIESTHHVVESKREKIKPNIPLPQVKPAEELDIVEDEPQILTCSMSLSHFSWYQKGWETGNCCGLSVKVAGQDYIVFKRSIGDDVGCGGGESDDTPCIAAATKALGGYPAFAWPTFDGKTFAMLPETDFVSFQYDPVLNDLATQQIANSEYNNPKGSPAGYRHLVDRLSIILFPLR